MSKLVIVGGSKGLGFAILNKLVKRFEQVYLFDLVEPLQIFENVEYIKCDLTKDEKICFGYIHNCDCLILCAGFGFVKPFEYISNKEIDDLFKVNAVSNIKLIREFYSQLNSKEDKKCLVISSIAGEVSSPLFSVYGATKASLSKICESLNIELEMSGSSNRITCVTAVSFEGSSFNGKETDIEKLDDISNKCIQAMDDKLSSYFYNKDLCDDIIARYNEDRVAFGKSSYEYKQKSGRINMNQKKQIVGYLSGTFDLFHIGHLNLLKRAKENCDYLIVGVHKDGSWKGKETFIPYDERVAIIEACKYVDEVHESFIEDSDAWDAYHFDKLFVGSDYKGTERFKKYEEYFKDKNVEIVYFPYTKGTSSTQLRERLSKK